MTIVHQLSRTDARRIAVRAQLLDAERPAALLDVVRHLSFLQLDPIAAVAPSADLVVWSRLGSSYGPAELRTALADRTLIELQALIRPAEDLALYRHDMAAWPGSGQLRPWQVERRDWVEANDTCRRDILARLKRSGPLPMRDLPDRCAVPWASTAWTNNRNVEKLLDLMVARGEVAVAGRQGTERLWDLTGRVYPHDPVVPAEEAHRIRNERRLRALGIARARTLAALSPVAGAHHEKADGSGYHKGLHGHTTDRTARVLTATDMYVGLTTERADRPAFSDDHAANELRELASRGVLEPETTDAVLVAAGHQAPLVPARRAENPGGLTGREVEVLRLAALGLTTKEIADRLYISPKTADHHIQHVYTKIEVSTRAAAALWAMQHDVVR